MRFKQKYYIYTVYNTISIITIRLLLAWYLMLQKLHVNSTTLNNTNNRLHFVCIRGYMKIKLKVEFSQKCRYIIIY